MKRYRHIGVVHHGLLTEAREMSAALAGRFGSGRVWWTATQETLSDRKAEIPGTELIVTIGGDGTILRGVHVAAPLGIPVLGVNMGRVGFMSEIDADDAVDGLEWYLDGNARIEERAMLRAQADGGTGYVDALNDVMLVRGESLKVIEIETRIDGVMLSVYRGDGVVVATPTGSTGYTLALGGPVIDPSTGDILLKPIAAHMSQSGGVIVRSASTISLKLISEDPAILSADGFANSPLLDGRAVRIVQSPHRAKLLRRLPPQAYWASLSRRLGMRQGAMPRNARDGSESEAEG